MKNHIPKNFIKNLANSKRPLLEMHSESNADHVGGNLSYFDALFVLFELNSKEDMFVLSKGHVAGDFYIVFWSLGNFSDSGLKTFCKDDSKFPRHTIGTGIPCLIFPTEFLGHWLSLFSCILFLSI